MKRIAAILNQPFLHPVIDVNTRWNSTYLMLERLIQIRDVANGLVQSRLNLKEDYLENGDWEIIEDMIQLLKPFYTATSVLSGTSQPSNGTLRLIIQGLLSHLEQYILISTHHEAAKGMKDKLREYWTYLSQSSTIPALLDPSTKFETFYEIDRKLATDRLKASYSLYKADKSETAPKLEDSLEIFRKLMHSSESRENETETANELATYLSLPREPGVNPLLWWKINATRFPTVALMAADYFALQVTSVPCVRAFSTAKNTIDFTRNSLLEQTVRASLCLKSWLEAGIIE